MAGRAEELIEKGDKKCKKFFGGSQKYEDAREFYEQAANQYKKVQDWPGAARAWMKCYEMDVKTKSETDMVAALSEAAKAYRKFDTKEAQGCIERALVVLDKQTKFDRGAKLSMEAAQVVAMKMEDGDSTEPLYDLQKELLYWYEKARDYYKMMKNSAQHCSDVVAKIADIKVAQNGFQEAIEMFDELGRQCTEDNLLRFNAKGYFFSALLCQLALVTKGTSEGIEPFRRRFEDYTSVDLQFCDTTHEYILCKAIIAAYEEEDVKLYAEAVRKYERIIPLDRNREVLLMKGKAVLKSESEDTYQ